jgi:ferritin-like metal-binding protein YciE
MPIETTQQLLVHELQSIQDAETLAAKAIEAQLQEVEDDDLSDLLERRLKAGEQVLRDIRKSLQKFDGKGRVENKAARGLIEESEETAKEVSSAEMKDAVIIAGAQKLEHYCIAAWGTVKAIAGELQEEDLAKAMQRALDEGHRWDEEMSELAESAINPAAMEEGQKRHGAKKAKGKSAQGSAKKH